MWAQFEEVVVTEKKQKGLNFKVKKLNCKKCKKLFTMPKDSCTLLIDIFINQFIFRSLLRMKIW